MNEFIQEQEKSTEECQSSRHRSKWRLTSKISQVSLGGEGQGAFGSLAEGQLRLGVIWSRNPGHSGSADPSLTFLAGWRRAF
ncbi:MAG: hypothetical protein OXL41_03755 [Nitrospinae bacterium]|nr:hypothetical protein [Nitrospinota bacterium]